MYNFIATLRASNKEDFRKILEFLIRSIEYGDFDEDKAYSINMSYSSLSRDHYTEEDQIEE